MCLCIPDPNLVRWPSRIPDAQGTALTPSLMNFFFSDSSYAPRLTHLNCFLSLLFSALSTYNTELPDNLAKMQMKEPLDKFSAHFPQHIAQLMKAI